MINQIHATEMTLQGYMEAILGSDKPILLRKFNYDKFNSNGTHLLDLCADNKRAMTSTFIG